MGFWWFSVALVGVPRSIPFNIYLLQASVHGLLSPKGSLWNASVCGRPVQRLVAFSAKGTATIPWQFHVDHLCQLSALQRASVVNCFFPASDTVVSSIRLSRSSCGLGHQLQPNPAPPKIPPPFTSNPNPPPPSSPSSHPLQPQPAPEHHPPHPREHSPHPPQIQPPAFSPPRAHLRLNIQAPALHNWVRSRARVRNTQIPSRPPYRPSRHSTYTAHVRGRPGRVRDHFLRYPRYLIEEGGAARLVGWVDGALLAGGSGVEWRGKVFCVRVGTEVLDCCMCRWMGWGGLYIFQNTDEGQTHGRKRLHSYISISSRSTKSI